MDTNNKNVLEPEEFITNSTEVKADKKLNLNRFNLKIKMFWQRLFNFLPDLSFNKKKIFILFSLIILALTFYLGINYLNNILYQEELNSGQVVLLQNYNYKEISVVGDPVFIQRTKDTSVGLVVLKNENKDLGTNSYQYNLNTYKQNGEVLEKTIANTYVPPATERYLIFPFKDPQVASFIFTPGFEDYNLEEPELRNLSLKVLNLQKESNENRFNIFGKLVNYSSFNLKTIDVIYILRTPSGLILGAGSSVLGPLSIGEATEFNFSWPKNLPENTEVNIYPYVDPFSVSSISLE